MEVACSLYCLLATRVLDAVIFRRGPSKQTCLISWNRANDTFVPGQWVQRSRVYPERSDISADGEWLITFLGRFVGPFYTWTVLSKPPFFSAIALWPKGDTWGGGGAFLGDKEIVLNHHEDQCNLAPGFSHPPGFEVYARSPDMVVRLERYRARVSTPWQHRIGQRNAMMKVGPRGLDLAYTWHQPNPRRPWEVDRHFHVAIHDRHHEIPGAAWADIDANGDVLFSVRGALYRLPVSAAAALEVSGDVVARARCIADFTDLRFCNVVAPYKTIGTPEDGFAPRLDRVTKEDRRMRAKRRERARDATK